MACQPPILPSARQTKGMDGSQTEFLNLAWIKGLNRKSQSTGKNVNELHNPQLSEKTTAEGLGKARQSLFHFCLERKVYFSLKVL